MSEKIVQRLSVTKSYQDEIDFWSSADSPYTPSHRIEDLGHPYQLWPVPSFPLFLSEFVVPPSGLQQVPAVQQRARVHPQVSDEFGFQCGKANLWLFGKRSKLLEWVRKVSACITKVDTKNRKRFL